MQWTKSLFIASEWFAARLLTTDHITGKNTLCPWQTSEKKQKLHASQNFSTPKTSLGKVLKSCELTARILSNCYRGNSESEVHVFSSRGMENTTTEHEPSLNRERRKHKGSRSVQTASHTPGLHYLGKRGPHALLDQSLDFDINLNNIKFTQWVFVEHLLCPRDVDMGKTWEVSSKV